MRGYVLKIATSRTVCLLTIKLLVKYEMLTDAKSDKGNERYSYKAEQVVIVTK